MTGKLALGNFKKSAKEFLIYFLTLAFGVCIFYAFNSLDSQQVMQQISTNQNNLIKGFMQIIGYISIFISIILAFLILYANKYLIKRRKKEFGIYMILGMPKSKISQILVIETLIVGIFSLGVGLILGILVSQGLSILTAKMFAINLTSFKFTFSIAALQKTILYFAIIFLVVMVFNTISISKYKLIDLLYADKKNEKLRFKNLILPVILFIASIAILILAYYRIIHYGIYEFDSRFRDTILLGCLGTFLFFFSLAGFALKLIQMNKKVYYKGLNMFISRQINSKINTNFISMSVVCLMLFITILTFSGGFSMASLMSKGIDSATSFDATIEVQNIDNTNNFDAIDKVKKMNINIDKISNNYNVLNMYEGPDLKYQQIIYDPNNDGDKNGLQFVKSQKVDVIPISQANNILKLQNMSPIEEKDNSYYIMCSIDKIKKYFEGYLKNNGKINLNGFELASAQDKLTADFTLYDSTLRSDIIVIVPDKITKNMIPESSFININYINSKDKKYEDEFNAMFDKSTHTDEEYKQLKSRNVYGYSKAFLYDQSVGLKVIVTYIALYIGIVFLITSAAVLALQQLMETLDNVERYKLLKKIGTEKSMINKAIFTQIAIYFLVPLFLAIVHSIIGIRVLNDTLNSLCRINMLSNILITAFTLLVVYGGYMYATYVNSKNAINTYDRRR